jgi:ppGpp synthetase/RelA/SpoT-type nucleotidyltranferase
MSEKTADDWGEDYRLARGTYEDLCVEIRRLVERLMLDDGIAVAQVESRTKKVESFVDKIRRKGGKYADPTTDMTDLAALRVIAYFPADVVRIGELVDEHFEVEWENSRRQSGETDPDRFGYRSDHYVVRLSTERLGLPEYRRFDGCRAEIQVRTVMQHAWAAVDHRLRYKNPAQLPAELRRRLSRLSALLEVADEQFAAVKQAADELEATYADEVKRGDLSAAIDLLSLDAFVQEPGVREELLQAAYAAGFLEPHGIDLSTWDLGPLANALEGAGIRDLARLRAFLSASEAWRHGYLVAVGRGAGAVGGVMYAIAPDVLWLLALRATPDDETIRATRVVDSFKTVLMSLRRGTWD